MNKTPTASHSKTLIWAEIPRRHSQTLEFPQLIDKSKRSLTVILDGLLCSVPDRFQGLPKRHNQSVHLLLLNRYFSVADQSQRLHIRPYSVLRLGLHLHTHTHKCIWIKNCFGPPFSFEVFFYFKLFPERFDTHWGIDNLTSKVTEIQCFSGEPRWQAQFG